MEFNVGQFVKFKKGLGAIYRIEKIGLEVMFLRHIVSDTLYNHPNSGLDRIELVATLNEGSKAVDNSGNIHRIRNPSRISFYSYELDEYILYSSIDFEATKKLNSKKCYPVKKKKKFNYVHEQAEVCSQLIRRKTMISGKTINKLNGLKLGEEHLVELSQDVAIKEIVNISIISLLKNHPVIKDLRLGEKSLLESVEQRGDELLMSILKGEVTKESNQAVLIGIKEMVEKKI